MKLVCPKCHSKSTVPDERVPAAGAWARCPKCSERFFIRPVGQSSGLDMQPQKAPVKSVRGRSEEAQRMINRLRSKTEAEGLTTLDGPEYNPETITVFPQPAPNPAFTVIATGVMIVLAGFVLIGSFSKGSTVKVNAPQTPAIMSHYTYGEKDLRADFQLLRKRATQQPHLRYQVTYTGYESRVFKHFLNEIAPDDCQDITSLYIKADRAANSLTATATCQDNSRIIPDMQIRWEGRDALISITGREALLRFNLFPPADGSASGVSSASLE